MTSTEYGSTQTHKDEGRIQVFVVLPGIISVEFFRFFTVYGKEVGSGVVGPEGFNELLEGGVEAGGLGCQRLLGHCSRLDSGSDVPLWIDLNDRRFLLLMFRPLGQG